MKHSEDVAKNSHWIVVLQTGIKSMLGEKIHRYIGAGETEKTNYFQGYTKKKDINCAILTLWRAS